MSQVLLRDVAVVLRETDNVAVLKRSLKAGDELVAGTARFLITRDIGRGHKVALEKIADGAPVRKYGQIIGFARGEIEPGAHVHLHNLVMKDFARDYQFCSETRAVDFYSADRMRFFQGYARPGGRVGTRNYIAVLSSVNCSASVSLSDGGVAARLSQHRRRDCLHA
jgi:altronate dehydratase